MAESKLRCVTCRKAGGGVQFSEELRGLGILGMAVTRSLFGPLSTLCFDAPARREGLSRSSPSTVE